MTNNIDFKKMNGLVPAVIQHASDGAVLMVGFMNEEALRRTEAEGQVVFWSRSKQRLWKKGETSGNFLNVVSIDADCDRDALLIRVTPTGPVCHTGERGCFPAWENSDKSVLKELEGIIDQRRAAAPESSYTAKLLQGGSALAGQKVGEEAVEFAIAAQYNDRKRCTEEAADLFYHALVLLATKDIEFTEVEAELSSRMKNVT